MGHPGASSQEGILPPHSLKSTSIELLISIPHLLSNPVLSFLELPKESILEFWNKGSESESSIEKVAFFSQPTHFHLKQFSEDSWGLATVRFFDLQKKQLFSEFQIEKHP